MDISCELVDLPIRRLVAPTSAPVCLPLLRDAGAYPAGAGDWAVELLAWSACTFTVEWMGDTADADVYLRDLPSFSKTLICHSR